MDKKKDRQIKKKDRQIKKKDRQVKINLNKYINNM